MVAVVIENSSVGIRAGGISLFDNLIKADNFVYHWLQTFNVQ